MKKTVRIKTGPTSNETEVIIGEGEDARDLVKDGIVSRIEFSPVAASSMTSATITIELPEIRFTGEANLEIANLDEVNKRLKALDHRVMARSIFGAMLVSAFRDGYDAANSDTPLSVQEATEDFEKGIKWREGK